MSASVSRRSERVRKRRGARSRCHASRFSARCWCATTGRRCGCRASGNGR
jgi:hypothetical protein